MIIIIDNYDSFTYNLYQLVAQLTDKVQVIRNDKISVTEIKALNPQGIILSPGPGRPEKAGICVDLVKNLSGSVPILGVCLGHQAIACAFAANIIQNEEIVHGKSAHVFHNRRSLYQSLRLPFAAGRYHSLIVEKTTLPQVLRVEAENSQGVIMGIKHREHATYGVQFHPESILSAQGKDLLNNFIKICYGETVC